MSVASLLISIIAILFSGFAIFLQYFSRPKIELKLRRHSNNQKPETLGYHPHSNSKNNLFVEEKKSPIPLKITFTLEISNKGHTACGVYLLSYDLKIDPQEKFLGEERVENRKFSEDNRYLLPKQGNLIPLELKLSQNDPKPSKIAYKYLIQEVRAEGPFSPAKLNDRDLNDINKIINGETCP